jgi:hypothetical protein
LLHQATRVWIFVARDIDTNDLHIFANHPGAFPAEATVKPLGQLTKFLSGVTSFIGHNIIMFDLMILKKFYDFLPSPETKIFDTLVASQVLNYRRFGFGHSLGKWGEHLGFPKVEHEDWTQFSDDMINRCVVDVDLNVRVFQELVKEIQEHKQPNRISLGIRAEQGASMFMARAQYHGFPFNRQAAQELLGRLEAYREQVRQEIEPLLSLRAKKVDQEPKSPAWIKNGNYAARTANWFEIDPSRGQEDDRPVWGEYSRIEFVQPDMGSVESIKLYLKSIGWEPDDWNYKKVGRQMVKVSEKLTDTSLEKLGEVGLKISRYLTTTSRRSTPRGLFRHRDPHRANHPQGDRQHSKC